MGFAPIEFAYEQLAIRKRFLYHKIIDSNVQKKVLISTWNPLYIFFLQQGFLAWHKTFSVMDLH